VQIDHLKLFMSTARLGNLTRAAAEADITQSTATRWLQVLEQETGGRLFERAGGGLRLSGLGRAFLPYAERSVRAVDDGLAHLHDVRTGRAGRLLLGCSEVTSTYFLPRVLRGFRHLHPGADVRVRTSASRDITDSVKEGELDVALVATVPDPGLDTVLLQADELEVIAAPNDPLSRRPVCTLEDVAARGVILYGVGDELAPYGLGPFLAAHLEPRVAMEVDSVETAKRMVAEGFGVALLPHMAVADVLARQRLASLCLAGVDLGHWHVRMVRRSEVSRSALAESFWDWCLANTPQDHPHH
jgi:DNA-binding transcriptional LysR family regulator